ncbi:hypothetical protein [Mycolicibacterium farcinogenes]|uniref:Uncharacterized protein n=1 Tax=Mycolicibacterium farcinogenes TaxID=1802 RepID=A0ACD1FDE2_MYCFR|nr:hypothetical protein [Mycolicibacterium farcinogenes]QZH65021.1 hypothetical protein K6L26_23920 [Mycolicibacterium farcinogenes]
MSPAAGAASPPTRSEIEEWSTAHLSDAATTWRTAAAGSESAFDQHRQNVSAPGGTTWEGTAKDAALDRVAADIGVVGRQSSLLREAATLAENGSYDIKAALSDALEAITTAEADGFRVAEDLSLTDTREVDAAAANARQTAANEHAEDIRWAAQQLAAADKLVGDRLEAKAAELQGIRFEGEGDGRDGTVRFVDHETEDPETETDTRDDTGTGDADDPDADAETGDGDAPVVKDPKGQNEDYPNRNNDGTYRGENSRDGKDAEKAALDKREEDTGITLERQQVRATHPDVINPKTGKPQHRYYDAVEPTDDPDEYIGIEAKSHEGLDRTTDQERFDDAVTPDKPATATLDGREIRIIDTDLAYPPEGWDEAPADSGAESSGSETGGADAKVGGPSLPPGLTDRGAGGFGGVHAEGTVPTAPTPTPAHHFPDWGTHLTPQQMIDSDDPAMRVLGQQLLEQQRQRSGNVYDPDSMA